MFCFSSHETVSEVGFVRLLLSWFSQGRRPGQKKVADRRLEMDDDDPTGEHRSDTWSVIDAQSEPFSRPPSDHDVLSVASVDDLDVISIASSQHTTHSMRSARSARSATAIYAGDDNDTAPSGPVPLSELPSHFFSRRLGSEDGDTASLISVNTRRGWPRVAPGALPQPMASVLIQQLGSYRDAVLRNAEPEPQQQQQQQQLQSTSSAEQRRAPALVPRQPLPVRRGVGGARPHAMLVGGRVVLAEGQIASGWSSLSARGGRKTRQGLYRDARERLASLAEEGAGEDEAYMLDEEATDVE